MGVFTGWRGGEAGSVTVSQLQGPWFDPALIFGLCGLSNVLSVSAWGSSNFFLFFFSHLIKTSQ